MKRVIPLQFPNRPKLALGKSRGILLPPRIDRKVTQAVNIPCVLSGPEPDIGHELPELSSGWECRILWSVQPLRYASTSPWASTR